MNKNYLDFVFIGFLLGIWLILLSSEIRLIRLEKNIQEIKEFLEPTLPLWGNDSLE